MLRSAAKFLATAACTLSIWMSSTASTEAGVIPCVWNFLFGPCCRSGCGGGSCGYGGYAPIYGGGGCYGGSCGTSYYGPSMYYGGGCSSCRGSCGSCSSGSCGSCGFGTSYGSCGSCSSGSCGSPVCSTFDGTCSSGSCGSTGCDSGCSSGLPAGPTPAAGATLPPKPVQPPAPADRSPGDAPPRRTFDENPVGAPPRDPVPPAATVPDPNFQAPKKPAAAIPPADQDEGFIPKPSTAKPEAAPKAEVSPDEEKLGKPAESITNKPAFKIPPTDPIKDELDTEKRTDVNVQPLNLGDKIVWDNEPVRSGRREIRMHMANARLIRIPAFPSADWVPQIDPATIAKK